MPKPPDRLLHCWVLALTLVAAPAVAAQSSLSLQQLQHTSWTTKDGLPVTGIFRMMRTPDGYLWFGSSAGMLRFDGIRFTLIDSTVSPVLLAAGTNQPRALLVDHRGAFLFTGRAGELLEYRNGTFREITPGENRSIRLGPGVEDRQHRVWMIAGPERTLRQLNGGRLLPAGLPPEVPDTGVLGVTPDSGRGIWFGTRTQGIWHVSGDNQTAQHLATELAIPARPLLQDRTGRLWTTGMGFMVLQGSRWSRVRLPGRPRNSIEAVVAVQSADGAVWFGTRGDGLLRLRDGVLEQFSEADGLSDAVIHDVLIDPAGSVWISTDAGLDRLRVAPFVTVDQRLGLPFDSPIGIQEDADGSIWTMAYGAGGLFHLDGGLIRRAPGLVHSLGAPLEYPGPDALAGRTPNGGIWVIANNSGRLFRYHDGQMTPQAGFPAPPGLRWFEVLEGNDGTAWVHLEPRGFGVLEHGQFRRVALRPGEPDPSVMAMTLDPEGTLWVGTRRPSALYQITGKDLVRRIPLQLDSDSWPDLLTFEGRDTMWASVGNQLVRFSAGRMDRITLPEISTILGTSSRTLVLQDDYLWMASEGGVARMSLADLHRAADGRRGAVPVRGFDDRDGLRVGKMTTLNPDPAFRARDGRLWFATPAGLAVFDPGALRRDTVAPKPHVERLIVGGTPVPLSEGLALAPNPDRVELHFTATDLVIPERAILEYRLEGADRDWTRSGPDRVVAYAQLRPGRYTFRVRAWNEDGVPSRADAILGFRILPTWYQTWWFFAALLLLVAAAGAAALYAAQRARSRVETERLRARFDATLIERTRLARELHDTLLQGFTGITLQLQAIHHSVIEAPRQAAVALSRVLTTADITLREARQMVWDMRAPELVHRDLAEALEEAARLAVVDTSIQLAMNVNGRRRRLALGIETTALRIGREAVVNAVKHAAPSTIEVDLSFGESLLLLKVSDDGHGCDLEAITSAVSGGHWGIRGMQERATRAGGSLELGGNPAGGMRITLTLPVGHDPSS